MPLGKEETKQIPSGAAKVQSHLFSVGFHCLWETKQSSPFPDSCGMVSKNPTAFLCVGNLFMATAQSELGTPRRPPQMAITDTFPSQGRD